VIVGVLFYETNQEENMAGRAFKKAAQKPVTTNPDTESRQADDLDQATVAAAAYECWQKRGCPIGSDQDDWFQAEAELRAARSAKSEARVAAADTRASPSE
jgi:hypothetical protein